MNSEERDDLLDYYQRELMYLRNQGAEFAARYPKVAQRLELSGNQSPDPHVERLLESFAFLTARIQRTIDADFPEIPAALLDVLYPQLALPMPSMAIARFEVDPRQARSAGGFAIPDDTPLYARAAGDLTCRFRTCYPVELWPIEVSAAEFMDPGDFDFLEGQGVAKVLRLRLGCRGNLGFGDMAPDRLRIHIDADPMVGGTLYELLLGRVAGVAVRPAGGRAIGRMLPPAAVRPVGFAPEEDVLHYPAHAHQGYRLIQEYFAFPQKFLFLDVEGLGGYGSGSEADLLFLLSDAPPRRLPVDASTFRLNCAPIVNLFPKTSEPVRLDHTQVEYRLVPDSRWERSTEIHSIVKVSGSSAFDDDSRVFKPFYSYDHHSGMTGHGAFWVARRRPAERADLPGTEMTLAFLDAGFRPTRPPAQMVFAHTLCTNRRLAEQLDAGARLETEVAAPLLSVTCLDKPTPQVAPPMGGATMWRLISNLSLNHLSLTGGSQGLAALREILCLYGSGGGASAAQQVAGILALESRHVVRRIGSDAWRGFCRGTEVTLEFDETLYVGSSPYLLAAVLDRFLGLYAGMNSFSQLVIRSRQRNGIWKTWPPRVGERAVL